MIGRHKSNVGILKHTCLFLLKHRSNFLHHYHIAYISETHWTITDQKNLTIFPHGKMSPEPNISLAYTLFCPDGIEDGVLSSVTPFFDSPAWSLHLQTKSQPPLSSKGPHLLALSPSQPHCNPVPLEDLLIWLGSIPDHLFGLGFTSCMGYSVLKDT